MSNTIPILFINASWPSEKDRGATGISSEWAQQALRELVNYNARKRDYKIIKLCGSDATRENIEDALQKVKHKKGMVVFYGHGCKCGEVLYESQYGLNTPFLAALDPINCRLLSNKIVYAVACYSAKVLGKYVTRKGAISYIGYEGALVLLADHKRVPALKQAVNVGLELLTQKNATCIQAHSSIYRHFGDAILRCLKMGTQDAFVNAWALSLSRDALVSPEKMGKQGARLR